MKIDRNNYEAYALDYLEGNLSEDVRDAFIQFLACDPEAAEAVESVGKGMPVLPVDNSIVFEDKQRLKRKPATGFRIYGWSGAAAAVLVSGLLVFDFYREAETGRLSEGESGTVLLAAESRPETAVGTGDAVQAAAVPEDRKEEGEAGGVLSEKPAAAVLREEGKAAGYGRMRNDVRQERKEESGMVLAAVVVPEDARRSVAEVAMAEQNTGRILSSADSVGTEPEEELLLADAALENTVTDVSEAELVGLGLKGAEATNESRPEDNASETMMRNRGAEKEEGNGDKESSRGMFRNRTFRKLTAKLVPAVEILNPVRIYENNDERVVEFASITISRKSNKNY